MVHMQFQNLQGETNLGAEVRRRQAHNESSTLASITTRERNRGCRCCGTAGFPNRCDSYRAGGRMPESDGRSTKRVHGVAGVEEPHGRQQRPVGQGTRRDCGSAIRLCKRRRSDNAVRLGRQQFYVQDLAWRVDASIRDCPLSAPIDRRTSIRSSRTWVAHPFGGDVARTIFFPPCPRPVKLDACPIAPPARGADV